jgi:hypothetical protein
MAERVFSTISTYRETGTMKFFQPDLIESPYSQIYKRENDSGIGSSTQNDLCNAYTKTWDKIVSKQPILDSAQMKVAVFLHAEPEAMVNPSFDDDFQSQLEMICYQKQYL